ncbi:MAG: LPS assembly protein LptD, partial [Dokdonella sp.]
FPLDDRRLSGFLYPEIGYSNRRGVDITIPYYLNLAPNYDATIDTRLMTHRGVMLGGEFRYLFDNSRGTFEGTWLPNDRESDIDRGFVHWDNETRLGSNWGVSVEINHVSDDLYFQDFGRGLNTSSISLLPSRVYLQGRGSWWNASIGGDDYQISDPSISQNNEPYRRLPRALFSAEHDVLGDLHAGVDAEYVDFTKDNALDGRRLDLFPYLSLPIETAAYFVRPQIGYRYTSYNIDRASDRTPTRGVPIFDLDAGLVFEREIKLGDGEYTQTLEPRLYYLRVPYRDQSNLPLFDTQLVPFSFGQLFRTNAFVGADRQINANNLTLALTSRLLENASGDEIVSASIGQIRYFDDQLVQLPNRPTTDFSGSAYVAGVDLHLNSRWRVSLDQQWNPNTHQTDLSAVQLQHRFGDDGAINVSYRFRRGYLEQADISALVPITPSWRLVGRNTYSLLDSRTLERFFGVEHDTCCVTWRALTRHWIRSVAGQLDTQSDSALYFEVEFKGIGATGQQAENFLRRSVLGYQ